MIDFNFKAYLAEAVLSMNTVLEVSKELQDWQVTSFYYLQDSCLVASVLAILENTVVH